MVIENFPQNEFQAKFFNLNCKPPTSVFILNCPADICQERMNNLGESDPKYICSGILSQKIKEYNQKSKNLIPFLKKNNKATEIDSSQPYEKMMDAVYDQVEPFVIHIRPGAASNDLRKQITEKLSTEHGFINLDINALIRDENERKTPIGEEIHQMVSGNRIIPAEMIVRMLQKIIYSGEVKHSKFILTSFPDIIE